MTINSLATQFCDYSKYFKGYSDATIKRYRSSISIFCRFAQISNIEEVTTQNVQAWFFNGRSKRNWSVQTFLSYHKSLTVFFAWCLKNGHMTIQPLEGLAIPKLEHKLPTKLTKQDSLRLLEIVYNYPYQSRFVQYRNHAMFATLIFAGLRKKELLNLKYTDVDLVNQTLFVRLGKGNKDRMIPISATLAQSLQRYLEERRKLNRTCPEFFASYRFNRGLTEIGLIHQLDKIREATDIKFTLHKLRHTFATLMLEGGCDIYSLSKMMGHSDITTTTLYLYASADHLKAQMNKHPLNENLMHQPPNDFI